MAVSLLLSVILQGLGRHHDTYMSVYGSHPDNPFNKRRYAKLFEDQSKKP